MAEESVDLSTYRFSRSPHARLEDIDDRTRTTSSSHSLSEQKHHVRTHREHIDYSSSAPMLSWRLDPDESLSDWTLTVISNDDLDQKNISKDTSESRSDESDKTGLEEPLVRTLEQSKSMLPSRKYFVHKTQLAVGPRRSEYFSNLFKKKRLSMAESNETSESASKHKGTRIELRPSAANAFPIMLDFIYSPVGSPVEATTESAVALRHLATCFGIRELFDSITAFIKNDLSVDTAPTYLAEADTYKHEKLVDVCAHICSKNFEFIKFATIVTLPPILFEKVVTSPDLVCSSEVLSSRVAAYCRCRPGTVDAAMLKAITNVRIMPRIAPEESLFYLKILMELDAEERGNDEGKNTTIREKGELYDRCIKASAEIVNVALSTPKRNSTQNRQTKTAVREYNSLPPAIKVDLLEATVSQKPVSNNDFALIQEESRKHAEEAIEEEKKRSELEIEEMRKMYESKLKSYEDTIRAQQEELRAYASEMKNFVRVPNEQLLPTMTAEYTYQEEPEYDQFGESLYGQLPPSVLPPFGEQQLDGWILKEEKRKRDGRRVKVRAWPMYYYKGGK